jgi:penicillin-binding protein 1C
MMRALVFGIGFWLIAIPVYATVPSFESFKSQATPSEGTLYDRRGGILATQRFGLNSRRLDWVKLEDVSPALIEALLVAEDRRFYSHNGVDWQGVLNSLWVNLNQSKGMVKKRGASSISMQVAAMLNPDLARGAQGRDIAQKWDQMQAAFELEKAWHKQYILEAYLNSIFYRGELQGLAAASWGLFEKAPSGLNKTESALLASLIRAPNAKPTVVAQRACVILKVTRLGKNCDIMDMMMALDAATFKPQPYSNYAPHVAQALLSPTQLRIVSSIDGVLQRQALRILTAQLTSIYSQGAEDGAVVVLDNVTGEVLAYVGSSGTMSQAGQVDAAKAPRQAGSTLKPLLYALAIEQQRLTAATVLDDNAVSIPTDAGLYTPHNYDEQFIGDVSVRKALASSLNIPAVKTLALLKSGTFHQQLKRLGFSTLDHDAEHYGLSLALGSADVRLIELTNAYRTLANGGLHSDWRLTPSVQPLVMNRVISAPAAWIIGNILSDNIARAYTFGFDSVLATSFWTAVKTGTSKDMRDNWCIGYSQRYTVGVWVGNANGSAMHNVSGVGGAAPAWADLMRELHRHQSSRQPSPPSKVVAQKIRYSRNIEPSRTEWFVLGTQPTSTDDGLMATISLNHQVDALLAPRITQPVNGSLMAWDPDIPASQQGIVLKHTGAKDTYWALNGQRLSGDTVLWLRDRVTGRVGLSLHASDNTLLDSVNIELRGKPTLNEFNPSR